MTNTTTENIEKPIDNIENFGLIISQYCKTFLESREILEKEKQQNGGVISLEKLTEIFSEFNSRKQEIIDSFFLLNQEEGEKIKTLILPNLFNNAKGPDKRAIGEIKAGIENYLLTKN